MIAFGWVTNLVQRGMASWIRLLEVMDVPPAIADGPAPAPGAADQEREGARRIRGAIELRHVSFSYGDQPVLHDVTMTIPSGTTAAIVGATGSGKSTLLRLIPRVFDAPAGTVFVDGVDVRDMPLAILRGAIGFVAQEPFLFSATIAENIAYGGGSREPSRAAIEQAAAAARLDKDVESFTDRYDTLVGERGLTLSGGQKQRTAIARALVGDPAILILDDAFSAVDTHTEEEILNRLGDTRRGRTTVLVSHRISTVRNADRIFVMSHGRIVERGSHDELVRHDGIYAELHRRQLLEEELEAS
jgi:ATP-binding cassette subfamily B protein